MRKTLLQITVVTLAAIVMLSCKDNITNVNISKPQTTIGSTITSDTLKGSIKGTMVSGHTYFMAGDITVNKGDTLLMQSGVKLIVLPPPAGVLITYQINVFGSFFSIGTNDQQNFITVPDASRNYDNLFLGMWGGIQCDTGSGDVVIKWTHLEYSGGPFGNGTLIGNAGKTRYSIWYTNLTNNLIMEDSWLRGTVNDGIRTDGGHISIMRNTFEFNGLQGGESINVKSGTVGDIAYNVFVGTSTNGPKLAGAGGTVIQPNVNIYNNTLVNVGWRMVQSGRAGSTNIETSARGVEYNNMFVNCRTGFRLVPSADTSNTSYDYMYYYAQDDSIARNFYPADGVAVPKPHDIHGAAKQNNPQFVSYDVDQFDFTQPALSWPVPLANESHAMNEQGTANFRLKSTSPAIGKGFTGFAARQTVSHVGGDLGASITQPGKDIGAYQLDGSGNQH